VKTRLKIPKKPSPAFLLFASEALPNMSEEGSLTEKSKILGQRWKEMSEDKKKVVYYHVNLIWDQIENQSQRSKYYYAVV